MELHPKHSQKWETKNFVPVLVFVKTSFSSSKRKVLLCFCGSFPADV